MSHDIPTSAIDLSHHVQRQILLILRQSGPQTYAQLKPDGLEGNAYNYHLRGLKKSGLIMQEEDHYRLTATGHLVSDAFSFTTRRLMLRPYHYIAPLVTSDGHVLVYVPTREPLAGRLCLPSGKLHYGDSISEGIACEMERRRLSKNYKIESLCPINVRYTINGEVAVHRPGTVWHVEYTGERIERQTESGVTIWKRYGEIAENPASLPELNQAIARLKTGDYTPIDEVFEL